MNIVYIYLLGALLSLAYADEKCVPGHRCQTRNEVRGCFKKYYKTEEEQCMNYKNKWRVCINEEGNFVSCNCEQEACKCASEAEAAADAAKYCTPGYRCLTRNEVKQWYKRYYSNDEEQCLTFRSKKYCMFAQGRVVECDCERKACKCNDQEHETQKDDGSKSENGHKDGSGSGQGSGSGSENESNSENGSEDGSEDKSECSIKNIPSEYAGKTEEYCEKYGSQHTMCNVTAIGPDCSGGVCTYGMTEDQQNAMVKKHNMLRSKVAKGEESEAYDSNEGQPAAANMKKMRWNTELARVAGRYLAKCVYGHDKKRDVPGIGYAGQNAYYAWRSSDQNFDVTAAIDAWYKKEVGNFNPKDINPYSQDNKKPGKEFKVGHYTQVVWATSDQVGCGYIKFKAEGGYTHLVTCNYGPGGNFIGSPMYIEGSAGSACSGEVEDGLCL